jgi:hypothetical protein
MDLSTRLRSITAIEDEFEAYVLSEAARSELSDLPPSALEPQCSVTQTSGSLDVSGQHVVSVFAGGGRAHKVRPHEAASEPYSDRVRRLKRDGRAVYWTEGGTLHLDLPPRVTKAHVYHLPIPPLGGQGSSYNAQLQDVIAARAGLLYLSEKAASVRADLSLLSSLPDPPTVPSAPSIQYSDASAVAPSTTTIGTLPDAPQLTSLTRSIEGAPSLSDLDLGTQIDNTTALSPPSSPPEPSFDYGAAAKEAPTSTTIDTLPTPPSYSAQSASKPTQVSVGSLDLSTEIGDTTALDPPSKTLDFSVSEDLPTYNGPTSLSLSYSDYQTYFGAEDPEMSTEALEKLQTEVQEFEASVSQALQDFQNQVQSYSAAVQEEAEKAGVDVQDFQTDLQAYQAKVERQVQEHQQEVQSKIEEYTAIGNVEQAFHQLAIEQERARVQTELESYNREVERTLRQAQLKAQEAQQTAQNAQEAELRNAAQDLQEQVQEYEATLQQYQQDLQEYSSRVDRQIQVF